MIVKKQVKNIISDYKLQLKDLRKGRKTLIKSGRESIMFKGQIGKLEDFDAAIWEVTTAIKQWKQFLKDGADSDKIPGIDKPFKMPM